MKYEIFFLLQQYQNKYPDRFHIVELQEIKDKYEELKSEELGTDVCTADSYYFGGNPNRDAYKK